MPILPARAKTRKLRSCAYSLKLVVGGMGLVGTGGLAGSLELIWVVGSVAYVVIEQNMTDVRNEITRRYQEKMMPVALYQKAFGDDVPVPEQFLTRLPC